MLENFLSLVSPQYTAAAIVIMPETAIQEMKKSFGYHARTAD
jgi:hypothetical protein